jgi:glucose-1-phosphate cytidylyltransferase
MKAVILAGGFGTRLSEETQVTPKPMLEIGGWPVLRHIMNIYSHHGIRDFVICLGYKGYVIKEYFANYFLHTADVTFDLANNGMEIHNNKAEPWRVTLVDTGLQTLTGGRIAGAAPYLDDETFSLTYGDGVGDVDITALIAAHRAHGKAATVTAVRQPGRFGNLELVDSQVKRFHEKPSDDGAWINGGFFVLEPRVLDFIDGDDCTWEGKPLERLSADGELHAYRHGGFWQPMDTLRDLKYLNQLWDSSSAPWKVWP